MKQEHRGPILAAVLVAMGLPFLLPDHFSPGPTWLFPLAEAGLLVAVAATDPGRIDRRSEDVRWVRLALIMVLVVGAAWATARLIVDLVQGGPDTDSAGPLLAAGSLVWIDLVIVFALLYWELDSGGPGRRSHEAPQYPDLAFPQHMNPAIARPGWRPVFYDYLYLGLTDAIAFSPTDVMPLAPWAKTAMGLESLTSIVILSLVVARAVNVLGQ